MPPDRWFGVGFCAGARGAGARAPAARTWRGRYPYGEIVRTRGVRGSRNQTLAPLSISWDGPFGAPDSRLEVPGAGWCAVAAADLAHPAGATLVLARRDGLTCQETALLSGIAHVTAMTMTMLRLLDHERGAREEMERLAREQAARQGRSRAGGVLRLDVQDAGLIGLRDRVEATDGTFRLTSRRGEGTRLLIELPISAVRWPRR